MYKARIKEKWWCPKTSQYLVWPPFASCSATHLLRIELIRLLIVACGILVHSSSMAVRSCWILAGTGTRFCIHWSRASQTCSMGDMSGEYAGMQELKMFSFQELCTDPHIMGPCIIMLQHEVMVVDEWHNNGPQDLVTVSLCIQNAINKMDLCSLSITYACPYHNPTATLVTWAIRSTILTSANRSHTQRHTRCLPSALYSENRDSSMKRTPLQSARRHRMWAFAHSSQLRQRTAVRSRPRWGACRWASLRRFLTVCAEILWLYKKRLLEQLFGWLVSDDLGGEDARCVGPGLVWLHVVCGCETGWMHWQILWNAFGDGLW